MEGTFCKKLYEKVGATTEDQKFGASALVMAVIAEPMNKTGFTWDKLEDVERVIYGDSNLMTRIATLAGLTAGNDQLDAVKKVYPEGKSSYDPIFDFLKNREVVPGVCFK